MRAMQRRCELLMALKPGPPAYGEANPGHLRCCERETWLFDDHSFDRVSLCTITLRKRARHGEPCPGQIPASDADPRRNPEQPGGSRAHPREERRRPMRVVRVLAPGPDGEGEEVGTAVTVIEARRIAESVGWCRAYRSYVGGPDMVYDCLHVQLNYTWARERDLWVSDDSGGYGEPPTVPLSNVRGGARREKDRRFLPQGLDGVSRLRGGAPPHVRAPSGLPEARMPVRPPGTPFSARWARIAGPSRTGKEGLSENQ